MVVVWILDRSEAEEVADESERSEEVLYIRLSFLLPRENHSRYLLHRFHSEPKKPAHLKELLLGSLLGPERSSQ